jgi:hypothetical protein
MKMGNFGSWEQDPLFMNNPWKMRKMETQEVVDQGMLNPERVVGEMKQEVGPDSIPHPALNPRAFDLPRSILISLINFFRMLMIHMPVR